MIKFNRSHFYFEGVLCLKPQRGKILNLMDPKQRQALVTNCMFNIFFIMLTVICWVIFAFYKLNFILLSLKIGYLLTWAEDVVILLLWVLVQGIPGPQFTITFELLMLRTQEIISIPTRLVGNSWPCSQSLLNLVIWLVTVTCS